MLTLDEAADEDEEAVDLDVDDDELVDMLEDVDADEGEVADVFVAVSPLVLEVFLRFCALG